MTQRLVDLADRRLGGLVVAASDEWFAPKEHLLDADPPQFDAGIYSTRGKLMDGWETRRHSPTGDDWAIVRLGASGVVREAIVDTTHFRGNAPAQCALAGCVAATHASPADLLATTWTPLLDPSDLEPDHVNRFLLDPGQRVTHVRLTIAPDGGVARLRLLGEVVADLRVAVDRCGSLDLASVLHGGVVVAASEEFFSPAHRLLQVGDARDMSDGWETRRRRDDGHDWVVVQLATEGLVDRVEVDTTHFLGNHPQRCAVDVGEGDEADWHPVVADAPLGPHARHMFDIAEPRAATLVRLRILPDGGIARLRIHGRVTDDGWRQAGVRWLDTLAHDEAAATLSHCCASSRWVVGMLDRRPFRSFARLGEAADDMWEQMEPQDWREAFAAHPRIGDRSGPAHTRREQSGTAAADAETLEALAEANRRYEARFGHVFLINASGRSAGEMLQALRQRLDNDTEAELAVAAEQQRQIMHLRLDTMMRPEQPT